MLPVGPPLLGVVVMPRTRKAPGTAADSRNGRRLELAPPTGGERFDLPVDLAGRLLPQTITAWDSYWDDPVSAVRTPADRAVLLAWIETLDRWTKLTRAADQEPLQETSQGPVANRLYVVAEGVWRTLEALQAQLGIGPKNRVALGIAVLSERRTLGDLNKDYEARPVDGAAVDPRQVTS